MKKLTATCLRLIGISGFIALTMMSLPIYAQESKPTPDSHDIQLASRELETITRAIKEAKPLERADIQKFVTAIAIIHHYYITDVKSNSLFDNAINGMVSSLDPHSTYLTPKELKELKTTVSGEFVGIGIELTLKDGLLKVISPLDGSPAKAAGIMSNDIIIKVDGKLIRDISLTEAVQRIKGKKGTSVKLTVLRKGTEKPLVLSITRDTIKLISVRHKLLENSYGYARITFFQGPVEKQLRAAIKELQKKAGGKLKGFILDLRNNPGGLLNVSTDVANDFLDSKKMTHKYHDYIVYTKGRIPGANMHIKATPKDLTNNTPMVILINSGSASASEIVAGALQDYKRATIVGTRSFGKGSVQTVLPIGTDSALKLTTALYYTPAGQIIQARGIIPDVTIPELSIKKPGKIAALLFDEAGFENHILSGQDKTALNTLLKKRKNALDVQLKLAQKDYQLYEALMILKGISAR